MRIEKGPVQTVVIKLEAHNSIEYDYMLKNYDLYSWKLLNQTCLLDGVFPIIVSIGYSVYYTM